MTDKRTVYLDHAATTPIDPEVLDVVTACMRDVSGNASSLYTAGREAKWVLEASRTSVARSLGVKASEIVFTGSGTESDNLAVLGAARAVGARGKHVVVSSIEHKAVLEAAKQLEREGFAVSYVPVTEEGLVTVEAVLEAVREDTVLVSVMLANNEIGTIQPVVEIAAALQQRPAAKRPAFHTDACQAVGSLPVRPYELGVDLLTINSSKIYGPKGVGALWVRDGVRLAPQILGGGQERGVRAGTENVALIAGFAKALELAVSGQPSAALHLTTLRDYFLTELQKACPEITVTGSMKHRLPNNLHIIVPDLEGESLVLELDHHGVACATGSACSAGDLEPSHVLKALGINDDLIHGSLRFSLGRSTTKADLNYTVHVFKQAVARLRLITASSALRQNASV